MTFEDYRKSLLQFAKYPGAGTGSPEAIAYCISGLCGEAGEFSEKLKKIYRDHGGDFEAHYEDLLLELGDVLWYYGQRLAEERDQYRPDFVQLTIGYLECNSFFCDLVEGARELCAAAASSRWQYLVPPAVFNLALELGSSPEEIMDMNVKKLSSRKERGVLQGSGDHR